MELENGVRQLANLSLGKTPDIGSAEYWKEQNVFPGLNRKLKISMFKPNDG